MSTFLNRRLVVDKPMMIRSLPANWPQRGARLRVDPPALCAPGKVYSVELDLEANRATITEAKP